MIQNVLQVLTQDPWIRELLLSHASPDLPQEQQQQLRGIQTDAVSLDEHPKRYGSAPSIRFISGRVHHCCHTCDV